MRDSFPGVRIAGAMKDVMWRGELFGKISLDSLGGTGWYGIGPLEYLRGELLLVNGQPYVATVSDNGMDVMTDRNVKAPFFVYTKVSAWEEHALPDSVQTANELESYLNKLAGKFDQPFVFRVTGTVQSTQIHLVNLPEGATVSSPEEAHEGKKNFYLNDEQVEIVGFFSRNHKGIFTHHDSFIHMHLINEKLTMMGHVDRLQLKPGAVKLFLPSTF